MGFYDSLVQIVQMMYQHPTTTMAFLTILTLRRWLMGTPATDATNSAFRIWVRSWFPWNK